MLNLWTNVLYSQEDFNIVDWKIQLIEIPFNIIPNWMPTAEIINSEVKKVCWFKIFVNFEWEYYYGSLLWVDINNDNNYELMGINNEIYLENKWEFIQKKLNKCFSLNKEHCLLTLEKNISRNIEYFDRKIKNSLEDIDNNKGYLETITKFFDELEKKYWYLKNEDPNNFEIKLDYVYTKDIWAIDYYSHSKNRKWKSILECLLRKWKYSINDKKVVQNPTLDKWVPKIENFIEFDTKWWCDDTNIYYSIPKKEINNFKNKELCRWYMKCYSHLPSNVSLTEESSILSIFKYKESYIYNYKNSLNHYLEKSKDHKKQKLEYEKKLTILKKTN